LSDTQGDGDAPSRQLEHVLRTFTAERLAQVRQHWSEVAGEDEFAVELAFFFDWCITHIAPQDGDSQARELYHPGRDQTDAILEVVTNRRGAKLLTLFVSPEFWIVDSEEARTRVAELHAAAFVLVLSAGIAKGADVVKIYGRSNQMYRVLQSLVPQWPADSVGWDAKIEGRWMSIYRRK
jgi:hypothetical protein